jgi:hypothetical protein
MSRRVRPERQIAVQDTVAVAELSVVGEQLRLRLTPAEQAWNLCRGIRCPVSSVGGAGLAENVGNEMAGALGFPLPHFWLPGVRVGRWWTVQGCYVVAVYGRAPVLVLDMPTWWVRRIYVTVRNPESLLRQLPLRQRDLSDQLTPGREWGSADPPAM